MAFQCDGCERTIEHEPGDTELCGCKDHWGWMEVDGPAYNAFHYEGVHPMTGIVSAVRKLRIPNA